MKTTLLLSGVLVAAVPLVACNDGSPDGKIDTVDECLTRICELAAACTGVTATQAEIGACPAGIRSELSVNQLAELERITTYTEDRQNCVMACIGGSICGRFDGALSAISDSDVMEPFRACELQCP